MGAERGLWVEPQEINAYVERGGEGGLAGGYMDVDERGQGQGQGQGLGLGLGLRGKRRIVDDDDDDDDEGGGASSSSSGGGVDTKRPRAEGSDSGALSLRPSTSYSSSISASSLAVTTAAAAAAAASRAPPGLWSFSPQDVLATFRAQHSGAEGGARAEGGEGAQGGGSVGASLSRLTPASYTESSAGSAAEISAGAAAIAFSDASAAAATAVATKNPADPPVHGPSGLGTQGGLGEDLPDLPDTAEDSPDTAERSLARVMQKRDFTRMRVVGQFNLGFIIAELRGDLYILDQHACDEKVRV